MTEQVVLERIEYKGHVIKIVPDHDLSDPRDDDNLGTMICWHRRYTLGDKHSHSDHPYEPQDFMREMAREADIDRVNGLLEYWESGTGWKMLLQNADHIYEHAASMCEERVNKVLAKILYENYVILPLYLYDHSGITMSTHPFSCRWDSGQVGYIFASRETILKKYGKKRLTKALRKRVEKFLNSEVETYDAYISGDGCGYIVEKDGAEVDSCYGFYSNKDAIEYAKNNCMSGGD
jgi:hypothetical protein